MKLCKVFLEGKAMPTVYITQETANRNFLPARKYGELKSLMPGNAQVVLSTVPTVRKLRHGLKDYTDDDFLLLSGDPIIMGLAIVLALEKTGGRARFLKWDKREADYYDVTLNIHEKGELYA